MYDDRCICSVCSCISETDLNSSLVCSSPGGLCMKGIAMTPLTQLHFSLMRQKISLKNMRAKLQKLQYASLPKTPISPANTKASKQLPIKSQRPFAPPSSNLASGWDFVCLELASRSDLRPPFIQDPRNRQHCQREESKQATCPSDSQLFVHCLD